MTPHTSEVHMNSELQIFLNEFGLVDPEVEISREEELAAIRETMAKGYFRSPYDENGEITF